MTLILLISSLIGYKLFFQTIWGDDKSFSELYTNTLIILILFFFGLIDKLIWGPKFVMALGLIFLILSLVHLKQKKINPITINLHWDLLLYLGLIGLFFIKTKGTFLNSWDEFTYWGLIDKEMFINNSLPKSFFLTEFKDYPPGQALFHYFFTNSLGFEEGTLYFAQAILLTTPLLGLARQISWKNWPSILLLMMLINFNLFIFSQGIQTLMIDGVVSIYFSIFLIILFFEYTNHKKLKKLPFLLAITSFPLLKQIAFVLSLVVIAIWLIDKLFSSQKISKIEYFFTGGCAASIFISKFSWDYYVSHQHFKQSITSSNMSFIKYAKDLFEQNQHVVTVTKEFFNSFVNTASAYSPWFHIDSINFLWIFLFLIIIIVVLYLHFKDHKFLQWQIMISFGFVGFSLIHLLVYCYGMGNYSGETVASFSRYMNMYILSWMVFLIFYFIHNSCKFSDKLKIKICLLAFFVLLTTKGGLLYAIPRFSKEPYTPERLAAIDAVNKTRKFITNSQIKIKYVFQGGKGHEQNIVSYELYPTRSLSGCIRFDKPLFPGDIWTCDMTEIEFKSYLKTIDFFYIHNPDLKFCNEFSKIFINDCLHTFLYKIDKSESKNDLSLRKIF